MMDFLQAPRVEELEKELEEKEERIKELEEEVEQLDEKREEWRRMAMCVEEQLDEAEETLERLNELEDEIIDSPGDFNKKLVEKFMLYIIGKDSGFRQWYTMRKRNIEQALGKGITDRKEYWKLVGKLEELQHTSTKAAEVKARKDKEEKD